MGSKRDAARALLLLAVAVAIYAPVFDASFLHDDDELLTGNPIVRRGGRSFGSESLAGLRELWLPTPGTLSRFHLPGIPVMATALWLEWRLFGSDDPNAPPAERGLGAPGYHVVNVLLHGLCALLLWRLLARLALPGAWWAALLWAVHPVCVESVAWISEQKNTLSLAFLLVSALAWVRWTETRERAAWMLSLFGFGLALLSKPTVAPFPLVLLLLAWWRRRPLGADLRAALPVFAFTLASGLFAVFTQSTLAIGSERIAIASPLARIPQASFALGFYVWKAILPLDLVSIYPRWHETIPWPLQILPGLLAAALLVRCWRARDGWGRAVILGFGGFAVMLLPVLGLVPMSYMRHTLVADHFAYASLPFLVALLVGAAAHRLASRPVPLAAAAGLLAAAFAWQSSAYARVFHDGDTLWPYVAAKNPGSWAAHDQVGLKLMREGRPRLALAELEQAIALSPDRAEAHNNIAVLLSTMGLHERSLSHILRAAELAPENGPIRINCASALLAAGRAAEALPHFEAGLRLLPDYAMNRINYAIALIRAGRAHDAVAQLQRAVELDPTRADARRMLAAARRIEESGSGAAPDPD